MNKIPILQHFSMWLFFLYYAAKTELERIFHLVEIVSSFFDEIQLTWRMVLLLLLFIHF